LANQTRTLWKTKINKNSCFYDFAAAAACGRRQARSCNTGSRSLISNEHFNELLIAAVNSFLLLISFQLACANERKIDWKIRLIKLLPAKPSHGKVSIMKGFLFHRRRRPPRCRPANSSSLPFYECVFVCECSKH